MHQMELNNLIQSVGSTDSCSANTITGSLLTKKTFSTPTFLARTNQSPLSIHWEEA